MSNTLHTGFLVNARQSALVASLAQVRSTMWAFLQPEDAAHCARVIKRSWETNNAEILRDCLGSISVMAEAVEGAWDLHELAQATASQVLALEVF